MKILSFLISVLLTFGTAMAEPLRVGIAGLTHDHVNGILGRAERGDIIIVGIAEQNKCKPLLLSIIFN